MDYNLVAGLIYNMAVLLTLTLIYTDFQNKSKSSSPLVNLLFGLTAGMAGILIIASGFHSEITTFWATVLLFPAGTVLFAALRKSRYLDNGQVARLKDTSERRNNSIEGTYLKEELMLKQMQLSDVIEFLPDATLAIDSEKRVIIWNKAIEQMTGIPSSEMMGRGDYAYTIPFYGMPRPQLMDMVLENDKDVFKKYSDIKIVGETIEAETYCPALYDNRGAWIFMKVSPLHDYKGNVIGAIESIRDISEKKEAEKELNEKRNRLIEAQKIGNFGNWEFDIKNKTYWGSKEALEIFGIYKEERLFTFEEVGNYLKENTRNSLRKVIEELTFGETDKEIEFQLSRQSDGKERVLHAKSRVEHDLEGTPVKLLGIVQDITDKVKREEKILYLNFHDVLTGLYNRLFFEEEKRRLDTERQLPLSIIIADVDGLKLINDGFGYASGDRLLVEAGTILSRCCRSEDIISRIGGDEFCIILPQTTSEEAREISKRIRDLCEETSLAMGSGTIKVSISVGYATKTSRDQNLPGIIANAENSMRRRKLLERKSVRSDLMSSIKATMLEKSHETAEHAERMVMLSRAIGKKLNLSDDKIFDLELATTLHDIGKMSIDQHILAKTGDLTSEEWGEMKKHPEAGYRIAQATSELMPIAEYILSHHERWDGKGYPQGLKEKEIPLLARIINIVDSYDAMTTVRSYGKPLNKEEAIMELKKCSGTQFDPELIRVFLEEVLTEM